MNLKRGPVFVQSCTKGPRSLEACKIAGFGTVSAEAGNQGTITGMTQRAITLTVSEELRRSGDGMSPVRVCLTLQLAMIPTVGRQTRPSELACSTSSADVAAGGGGFG